MAEHDIEQDAREGEPLVLARDGVEREEALRDIGVVLEHGVGRACAAVARGPHESVTLLARRAGQAVPVGLPCSQVNGEEQVGSTAGGFDPLRLVEECPGLRERSDGQAVPCRHHLVIAAWGHTECTGIEELPADAGPALGISRVLQQLQGGCAVLEGAGGSHFEERGGPAAVVLAEHIDELLRCPRVELALHALAVGIPRRGEAALGCAHVAQHPLGGLAHDALCEWIARQTPPVEVDPQQQGIVVEHLLEMRHDPRVIDGIAREATAKLVVDAAAGHGLAAALDHRERVAEARRVGGAAPVGLAGASGVTQQELKRHGRRELRGATESPTHRVVGLGQGRHGGVEVSCRGRGAVGGHGTLPLRKCIRDAIGRGLDLVASTRPRLGDRREQLRERRHAVTRRGREVRAGIEGPALVVDEDAHRPASVPGECDGGVHVDGVDVGPLLAVNLDAHEVVVEHRRDRFILEGLVCHDMAPVARGVSDRDEDRHAAPTCFVEGVLAPLPPVDGVVRVLLEVRRGRVGKAVGHMAILPVASPSAPHWAGSGGSR